MNLEHLAAQIKRHEGLRLHPYRDTVGKITIGFGRNLSDRGISVDEAEVLLDRDIEIAYCELVKALPWVDKLDDARKNVLINMSFNMGINSLLTFKNTLELVKTGDYVKAAKNMLQSKWARQVGNRAEELADQMENGEFDGA